jgi:hypothetical protein
MQIRQRSNDATRSRNLNIHKRVPAKRKRAANLSLPLAWVSFRSNHSNLKIQKIPKNQRAFYEAVLKKEIQEMKSILESIIIVTVIATLFMGVMYLMKLGINYINTFDLDSKKEVFEKNQTLLCATGITNNQKLLVSKSNKWEIYKETYFKREDMLLEIRLCRVEE